MAEENVERFREAVEAFNRGDLQAWLDAFDPEAVFEPQVAAVDGSYVGRDVIATFMTTIDDLYEVFAVDLAEVRDLGDRLLAIGTATGVGKGSGIEQRTPIAILVSFRDGRMTHFKDYGQTADALEAAGLSE